MEEREALASRQREVTALRDAWERSLAAAGACPARRARFAPAAPPLTISAARARASPDPTALPSMQAAAVPTPAAADGGDAADERTQQLRAKLRRLQRDMAHRQHMQSSVLQHVRAARVCARAPSAAAHAATRSVRRCLICTARFRAASSAPRVQLSGELELAFARGAEPAALAEQYAALLPRALAAGMEGLALEEVREWWPGAQQAAADEGSAVAAAIAGEADRAAHGDGISRGDSDDTASVEAATVASAASGSALDVAAAESAAPDAPIDTAASLATGSDALATAAATAGGAAAGAREGDEGAVAAEAPLSVVPSESAAATAEQLQALRDEAESLRDEAAGLRQQLEEAAARLSRERSRCAKALAASAAAGAELKRVAAALSAEQSSKAELQRTNDALQAACTASASTIKVLLARATPPWPRKLLTLRRACDSTWRRSWQTCVPSSPMQCGHRTRTWSWLPLQSARRTRLRRRGRCMRERVCVKAGQPLATDVHQAYMLSLCRWRHLHLAGAGAGARCWYRGRAACVGSDRRGGAGAQWRLWAIAAWLDTIAHMHCVCARASMDYTRVWTHSAHAQAHTQGKGEAPGLGVQRLPVAGCDCAPSVAPPLYSAPHGRTHHMHAHRMHARVRQGIPRRMCGRRCSAAMRRPESAAQAELRADARSRCAGGLAPIAARVMAQCALYYFVNMHVHGLPSKHGGAVSLVSACGGVPPRRASRPTRRVRALRTFPSVVRNAASSRRCVMVRIRARRHR